MKFKKLYKTIDIWVFVLSTITCKLIKKILMTTSIGISKKKNYVILELLTFEEIIFTNRTLLSLSIVKIIAPNFLLNFIFAQPIHLNLT